MNRMGTRRSLAVSVAIVLTMGFVSACGSGDDPSPAAAPDELIEQQASEQEAPEQDREALEQEQGAVEQEAFERELAELEQDLERLMEQDPAAALAELEELLGMVDYSAFAAACELGAVFAVGEGCHVVGVGHFFVDENGWGVFDTDNYPDAEGLTRTLSGNTSVSGPNDRFTAESNDDGIWTITALP